MCERIKYLILIRVCEQLEKIFSLFNRIFLFSSLPIGTIHLSLEALHFGDVQVEKLVLLRKEDSKQNLPVPTRYP